MTEGERALALWLKRLELRSTLTGADRDAVMSLPGHMREYKASRDIVRLGEKTTHACLVVDGIVARFGQTASGTRQLTAFYIEGDMGDLHSVVLPIVSAPLQSTVPTAIYRVPHDDIRRAGERSATLGRAFWRDCVADAQIASEWLLNVGRRGAIAKLAHLICELACRYEAIDYPREQFSVRLTQLHLGEALGLTGMHINRTVKALRELGLVTMRDGDIRIVDWQGLAELGEFNPLYLHLSASSRTAPSKASPPPFSHTPL